MHTNDVSNNSKKSKRSAWGFMPKAVYESLKKRPEMKMIAAEIAELVIMEHPEECMRKIEGKINQATEQEVNEMMLKQITAEIGALRHNLQTRYQNIRITEGKPRKYYYSESSEIDEIEEVESTKQKKNKRSDGESILEEDLYPILSEFALAEFGVYSKRIDEKKSSNLRGLGGNKWLHPDIVGLEDIRNGWDNDLSDCVQSSTDKKARLWSFEVKIKINNSNVREAFFQTVSNSSWANFSYLAAHVIDGSTMKELRMLAGLHGIGLIKLDTENPAESETIILAREKPDVDWASADRLIKENKDFREYIRQVRIFNKSGDVSEKVWDVAAPED